MIVCIPVDGAGLVGQHWGRAAHVAIAEVSDGQVASWTQFDVGWDQLHDEGTEGAHHARIARFLREHEVHAVVAGGIGPGMIRMLDSMGIDLWYQASGDAKQAALVVLDPDLPSDDQGSGEQPSSGQANPVN